LDEFVLFNDVLTAPEIDQIRNGTYEGDAAQKIRDYWWWRRRH
jgi:hypothetical protein